MPIGIDLGQRIVAGIAVQIEGLWITETGVRTAVALAAQSDVINLPRLLP